MRSVTQLLSAAALLFCECSAAPRARESALPPLIAYWSGFELGNPLASLKDQPFGIVMLTMGFFYSDNYTDYKYDVCGWSLNVAVQQCKSNSTAGTNCGVKSWNEPPPACCSTDITKPNSAECPGVANCGIYDCDSCTYDPEPADCCFTPSGIDTRYLTLRHTLADIKSDVALLRSVGKKVMISMFDMMSYPHGSDVTLGDVNVDRGALSLASFVDDMGLDGVDFNYENINCQTSSISNCQWAEIITKTRKLLPDALISVTTFGIPDALNVLTEVRDVIDFAQEDAYSGATSFFREMKGVLGERKVYYGVEVDYPKTPLSEVASLGRDCNSSGAAGLFLWVANRDTNVSTSCLDPVNGGVADHPYTWAYTAAMWSSLFPQSDIALV